MKHTESAGGIVINNDTGKVLLTRQENNVWSLPKGLIDEGEDALTAAKREIYEETGVNDLSLIRMLGSYKRHPIGLDNKDVTSELKTIHIFLFTTSQTHLSPQDSLHPEARWLSKKEAHTLLTHRKDREFFPQHYGSFIKDKER